MPDLAPLLTLDVDGVDAEWHVSAVRGREEISQPWRYEVELYINGTVPLSLDKADDLVGKNATLSIEREFFDRHPGQKRELKGIVAEFHFLGAGADNWEIHRYRAVLAPPLWLASLRRQSRVVATGSDKKTDVDLVIACLTSTDPLGASAILNSDKIDDSRITNAPPQRDFVMQYEETDLDFYHRRLEKCGIFYVFEDDGTVRLCDANVSVPRIVEIKEGSDEDDGPSSPPGIHKHIHTHISNVIKQKKLAAKSASLSTLETADYAGMTNPNARIVTDIRLHDTLLPNKTALFDYNYQKPDLNLAKEHTISDSGSGVWAMVDENYGDSDPGDQLTTIRAEEVAWRERVLEGSSPVIELCSGRVFSLSQHPVKALNQDYLIVSADIEATRGAEWLTGSGAADGYQCRFRAIPRNTPFRPARTTQVPRIAGVLSGVVDGSDDDEPNVDDQGRYHVWFRFDLARPNPADSGSGASNRNGDASAPVRLMTPFGGEPEGMHMPLRKGTEVLIGFVNGDVDRPVILGTVPNEKRPSVVKQANRGASVIRTSSGVVVTLADF